MWKQHGMITSWKRLVPHQPASQPVSVLAYLFFHTAASHCQTLLIPDFPSSSYALPLFVEYSDIVPPFLPFSYAHTYAYFQFISYALCCFLQLPEARRDDAYQDLSAMMRCSNWAMFKKQVSAFRKKHSTSDDKDFITSFNKYWACDYWRGM